MRTEVGAIVRQDCDATGKHKIPWGQHSRERRLNVQPSTSTAPLPFQTEAGLAV